MATMLVEPAICTVVPLGTEVGGEKVAVAGAALGAAV